MLSLFCGGHGVALCDGFLASISGSEATVLNILFWQYVFHLQFFTFIWLELCIHGCCNFVSSYAL